MDKIKEVYKAHRAKLAVVLIILAAIAGATANITDDAIVSKIEAGVEVADKLLLDKEVEADVAVD